MEYQQPCFTDEALRFRRIECFSLSSPKSSPVHLFKYVGKPVHFFCLCLLGPSYRYVFNGLLQQSPYWSSLIYTLTLLCPLIPFLPHNLSLLHTMERDLFQNVHLITSLSFLPPLPTTCLKTLEDFVLLSRERQNFTRPAVVWTSHMTFCPLVAHQPLWPF